MRKTTAKPSPAKSPAKTSRAKPAPKPAATASEVVTPSLTHDELGKLAARWLRNKGYITYRESGASIMYGANERADVIGWHNNATSVLIECKTSRADFKADAAKECRRFEEFGFGVFRYFATPANLIQPAEVPKKWGLLWIYENKVLVKKPAERHDVKEAAHAERRLLIALLKRVDGDQRRAFEALNWDLPTRST